MAEPPPGGGDPPAPLNQAAIIAAAMNPYATVNLEEARKQKEQYGADLERTRGALSNVQTQRQDVTTRNLGAIDEAIKGLKESRTGTYGFDPAVSAAMAAGFLKTTPGVTSNFMGELGQAMGNAAPVIKGLQDKDRDSFQILADLQRKRGEFEAQPLLEQQTELSAREKLEFANLKEAEKALARAPTAAAATAGEKSELAKKKLIEDIIKRAQADADAATKGMMHGETGKPLSITEKAKIQKYLALESVKDHNRRVKEGSADWIDPAQFSMTQPEIDEAIALADKAVPDDKGAHRDYNEYTRSLKPGETPLSKPEWEAKNAAHKTVTVERAKELLQSESTLDSTLQHAIDVREIAQKLLTHPGVNGITGTFYGIEKNRGITSDEVAAVGLYDQLQANQFLNAIPNMKGFGQLTEAEGKKLGASQSALARRTSADEFRAQLKEIIERATKVEARLRERHAERERKAGAAPGGAGGAGTGGGQWKEGDKWTDTDGKTWTLSNGKWI